MLSRSEVRPVVQKLISSGLLRQIPNSPELFSENIYPYLRFLFTDKAGAALHKKINSTIHQRNEVVGHEGLVGFLSKLNIKSAKASIEAGHHGYKRVIDMVNYFGGSAREDNLDLALTTVINAVNDLAERGYITGAMAPLSIIRLARPDTYENYYCVVSYVAINNTGQVYVDKNLQHVALKEGDCPIEFGE